MQISTKGYLDVNRHDMRKYIDGTVKINTMLLLLKKETQIGSNIVYPDSIEARVHFHPDLIAKFGGIITEYKAWHHYVTKELKIEAIK